MGFMEINRIHHAFTDTGHWLARCNHDTGLIELNRREFPRLSPMMRDYTWCHEYVHLLYDIYDEDKCNEIANQVFISRAGSVTERLEREAFVANSHGRAMSSIAVSAVVGIVSAVASLGVKAYRTFNQAKDQGYYSLSGGDRYLLVKELLNASFKAAKQGGDTARDIFWSQMSQCSGVETDYNAWLAKNGFAKGYIDECETAYGFAFAERVPVDFWAKPVVKYSIIALAIVAVGLVLLKLRKNGYKFS